MFRSESLSRMWIDAAWGLLPVSVLLTADKHGRRRPTSATGTCHLLDLGRRLLRWIDGKRSNVGEKIQESIDEDVVED